MALEVGKLYIPGSVEEIRDDILTDIRAEMLSRGLSTDPPVHPGTDNFIWSEAMASAAILQYANIAIHADASDPRFAEGPDLDKWRSGLGLPEVEATGSTGKIVLTVSGTSTVPDGEQLTLPNGLRAQVVGTWTGVSDGDEIDIAAIDTGADTNAPAGTVVRFASPPINVDTRAKVAVSRPLTGGTDSENDSRKRTRILNRLANPVGGGNWSQKREEALNALATVQDAFVYPALGGPASERVVLVKDFDTENFDFSRGLSLSAVSAVRGHLHAEFDSPDEIVVSSVVDENVDVGIQLTIPDSSLAGGDGTGWVNAAPWPTLEVADAGRVSVTTATTSTSIIVSANTATAPVGLTTRIVWWSPTTMQFKSVLVLSASGSAGAWTLTLDEPLVDDAGVAVAAGDYIGPEAVYSKQYGDAWIEIMRKLGPGENTADANRLPRSKRHPYIGDESGSELTTALLGKIKTPDDPANSRPEIRDYSYGYRSLSAPTVPGSVATAPNVLVPRHFGIYPS